MTPKNMAEEFAFIFGFLTLYSCARFKLTKAVAAFFFLLCCAANNVHFAVYESWINAVNYYLSFIEIGEILNAAPTYAGKALIPFLWALVDVVVFCLTPKFLKQNKGHFVFDILFWAVMAMICYRSIDTHQEHGISPKDTYGRVKSNYFVTGYLLARTIPSSILKENSIPLYEHPTPVAVSKPKVKNIIMLMGESAASTHWSAFGYNRPTTPFISALKADSQAEPFMFLSECRSAGMLTRVALSSFINAIPYPNGLNQVVSGRTNLLHLAQNQHMETFWHTAQPESEMNIINLIGKAYADHLTYPTNFGKAFKEASRDDLLIDLLQEINLKEEGGKFIVLHQRGSHVPYGKLLNEDELVFGASDRVSMYDNTIRHTDLIIEKLLKQLNGLGTDDWLFVYTSDHGQYVTSQTANQGVAKQSDSYSVPVFIYSKNEELIKMAKSMLKAPAVPYHHQLAVFLMHAMGYENEPVDDGSVGYVNGNLLAGDAGWLKFTGASMEPEHVMP